MDSDAVTSFAFAKKTLLCDLENLEDAIRNVKKMLNDNETSNAECPVEVFSAMKRMRDTMWSVNTPADLSFMRMVPGSSQMFENELLKMAY